MVLVYQRCFLKAKTLFALSPRKGFGNVGEKKRKKRNSET